MEGSFLLLPQPEEVDRTPGTNAFQGDLSLNLDLSVWMKRLSSQGVQPFWGGASNFLQNAECFYV